MPARAQQVEPNHHFVTIRVTDAASLDRILAMDFDLASCQKLELPVHLLEVFATDADIEKMRIAGLDYRIEIRDYEKHIAKQNAGFTSPFALTPPVGQGAMGGHYTLAQIEAHLDKFAKDHPTLCTAKVSLGKSVEGRDIWMVKISDNVQVDENEPEVLYDAVHHAREPLSVTTTLVYMDWLLSNYATDPTAKRIVDTRELFFVPVVNPDGYEYNRSTNPNGGGMWRKNRRNNGSSYGVDLNRNWTTGWSAPNGGNSTNPTSETYRGPAPMSEPEIQALDAFLKTRKFVLGCSAHTYTDILLRPWGYQSGDPTNVADYRVIDAAATKVNQINAGAAADVLYIAAGTALDHYHVAYGMFGYSPELGRSNEGQFWPNPTNQVAISNRHQDMFKTFSLAAGSSIDIVKVQMAEGPGSNANGIIEAGESAAIRVTIENGGALATLTNVTATISPSTSGVTVTRGMHDFGTVAKFTKADNTTSPLLLAVATGFSAPSIKFDLDIQYEGNSVKETFDIPVQQPFEIIGTDFETNLGFATDPADTATTGRFERAAPQGTTLNNVQIQPNQDATPNGTLCWVTGASSGTSVGANDVDGGFTTLVTPTIDLSHVRDAKLEFQLWYAETGSNPDPFTVAMSRDGGTNWTTLFTRTNTGANWTATSLDIPAPLTATMRFRFRAQDTIQASVVEALVDDLRIVGVTNPANMSLLGGGQRGSMLRLAFHGVSGAAGLPLLSTTTQDIAVPGIGGRLLVGFTGLVILPPFAYGTENRVVLDGPIPQDASLVGIRFYWQQLLVNGSSLQLGNSPSIRVQ
ncbi:MAG: zinc carboxypeptidase [Planctomycetes bacterium]|nr:zinc carboxypeptidase [Planctomycetota bacterium]